MKTAFTARRADYIADGARSAQHWLAAGARVLSLAPLPQPATRQEIATRVETALYALDAPELIPGGGGYHFIGRPE